MIPLAQKIATGKTSTSGPEREFPRITLPPHNQEIANCMNYSKPIISDVGQHVTGDCDPEKRGTSEGSPTLAWLFCFTAALGGAQFQQSTE